MSYNGWSNRETWLVNVWFDPQSRQDVEYARDCLDEKYDELTRYEHGIIQDMLCGAIDRIDWNELLEHFPEDSCSDNA